MKRSFFAFILIITARPSAASWRFAVSGDSRNCGDVVMPAIASGVKSDGAEFYWHLGDFRWMTRTDEDIRHDARYKSEGLDYRKMAWGDFIDSQLKPFGELPIHLAIGNHEMTGPRSRREFIDQFAPWLDRSGRTYHRWTKGSVDFISLDNASSDQFDDEQLSWLENVLGEDKASSRVKAVVVGMHAALPGSISSDHSMEEWGRGVDSGKRAYRDLLAIRQAGKRVYVLASHSHYYMKGIFNADYWKKNGGILPGWIVGTAGARRRRLPERAGDAEEARTKVSGYLLAEVSEEGEIDFRFKTVEEKDVPDEVRARYPADFVRWCFADNAD